MVNKEEIMSVFLDNYTKYTECVNSKDVKTAAKKIRDRFNNQSSINIRIHINRNGEIEIFDKESNFIYQASFKDSVVGLDFSYKTIIGAVAKDRAIRNFMVDEIIKDLPGWGSKRARVDLTIEDEFPEHIQSLIANLEETLKSEPQEKRESLMQDITLMLSYIGPEKYEFKQIG